MVKVSHQQAWDQRVAALAPFTPTRPRLPPVVPGGGDPVLGSLPVPRVDWLQATVWIGAFALAIVLAAVTIVISQNITSKALVLAGSAFLGASIIFVVNLVTELRSGPPTRDRVTVEYTVDRAVDRGLDPPGPEIRSWRYGLGERDGERDLSGLRLTAEVGASNWVLANDPAAFAGDRKRLSLDLALYSLVTYLTEWQFD